MKVTHKIKQQTVAFYINSILFCLFRRDQFVAIHTWLSDRHDAKFRVSVKLKDGSLELAFDTRPKFMQFLTALEEVIDSVFN